MQSRVRVSGDGAITRVSGPISGLSSKAGGSGLDGHRRISGIGGTTIDGAGEKKEGTQGRAEVLASMMT